MHLTRFGSHTAVAGVMALALTALAAPSAHAARELYPEIASLGSLSEFRTLDGTMNNTLHPTWGAANSPFARFAPAAYADGVSAPAGADRPSARSISNAVSTQEGSVVNSRNASDLLWQWGQFIDHDLTLTPLSSPRESIPIPIPPGDKVYDPSGSGTATMELARSLFVMVDGVREQFNINTHYIDGSMVYGSDDDLALGLRTGKAGLLKLGKKRLLPFNVDGLLNEKDPNDPTLFIAGDARSNEQPGLTAMHTLFVREHNWWARQIRRELRKENRRLKRAGQPQIALTDDNIYQFARAVVVAEIQHITYNEFLPILLGPGAIPEYSGYDPNVDATLTNEFSTGSYRLGHTLLSPNLQRLDRKGRVTKDGPISLRDSFFLSRQIVQKGGVDILLRGLAMQRAQELDHLVIEDVRSFVFGIDLPFGRDLVALNLQRGREHAIPTFNETRMALGLEPHESFAEITSNPDVQARLANAYPSVDQVELFIGNLCEDDVPGSMMGETLHTIIANTFTDLRDGDRFWYENYLPSDLQSMVERQSLAAVLKRNTTIRNEIGDDAFHVPTAE